jgi:diguanylate cyclase (GGDEF)-like protein/PAS domain S-box-containing protein
MADILVVDDWPINREFLATLLRYAGHSVREAADGAEALGEIQRASPDLLITDVLMPVMDGTELANRLAANPALARVPIIFYTASYRLSEAQTLAAACGVTTVLGKPSEPQVLLDAVHGKLGLPLKTLGLPASLDPRPHTGPPTQQFQVALTHELDGLRARLQTSVGALGAPSAPAGGGLEQIATRVDDAFLLAQALSMRLATLIELGIELSRRESPAEMLGVFSRGARDVLNARRAVACVLDESGSLVEMAATGFSGVLEELFRREFTPTAGIFGELLQDGRPRVLRSPLDGAALGLPRSHPPIEAMLAVRIASRNRTFGWFYVAERLGADGFTPDDVHVAEILAAQLATQYENRVLLDRMRRHAGLLEVEVRERQAAAELLRESELRFRQLAENIREVFFLRDAVSAAILYVSPAYSSVWQRSVDSLIENPRSWFDAVHPDDRSRVSAEQAATGDSAAFTHEYRIVRPDGSIRWIRSRGFPILDRAGRVYRVAGIAEDITDAKEQALHVTRLSRILRVLSSINSTIVRTHERGPLLDETCRIVAEDGGFPIVWIGLNGADGFRTVAASRGLDAATIAATQEYLRGGRANAWMPAREALTSKTIVVHEDLRAMERHLMGPVSQVALTRGCRSVASLPLLIGDNLVGTIVLYAKDSELFDSEELALLNEIAGDVSFALQYIEKEEQLHYLAYYDSLTGLPNGALFLERIAQSIDAKPRLAAVFLADLDRFTHVNDSLGRHAGDRLLAAVAERLKAVVPEPNLLARVGADTFAIGVSTLRHDREAGNVLQERIFAALSRPFEINDVEVRVSARAGVALYPNDGTTADMLFKNAEVALKGAQATNARFLFYSPQINSRVAADLTLEHQLRAALERNEFRVFYQPKVASKTAEVVGLEALLRWESPDGGLVSPDRFIRVLEETELILDVGQWVIEQALRDYRSWEERGLRAPRIAVNVSPIQLRYADFPEMVLGTIRQSGIGGSPLELEVTESVIMADIEASTERLQRLNDMGVRIAIDDFGTGYSSLRYLATLPVDTLKIDRSFIVRMTSDQDSMTLVSTMISLAHSFQLDVVAEGVDSEEQAHLLRLMKCDVLQGYLFGKPVPASDIERFFARD